MLLPLFLIAESICNSVKLIISYGDYSTKLGSVKMKVCTICGKYRGIKHRFKFCPYCGSQDFEIVDTETKAKKIRKSIDLSKIPKSERR